MATDSFRLFNDRGQLRAGEVGRLAGEFQRRQQYMPGGAFLQTPGGELITPPVLTPAPAFVGCRFELAANQPYNALAPLAWAAPPAGVNYDAGAFGALVTAPQAGHYRASLSATFAGGGSLGDGLLTANFSAYLYLNIIGGAGTAGPPGGGVSQFILPLASGWFTPGMVAGDPYYGANLAGAADLYLGAAATVTANAAVVQQGAGSIFGLQVVAGKQLAAVYTSATWFCLTLLDNLGTFNIPTVSTNDGTWS